ncbi:MAG: hypothetical protein GY754_22750 [bacterium]|nr:hypothetical protein [bacterium]
MKKILTSLTMFLFLFLLACGSSYLEKEPDTEDLEMFARFLARISVSALAFEDHVGGAETLEHFKYSPQITAACIYDDRGDIFAKYTASGAKSVPPKPKTGPMHKAVGKNGIEIFCPIIYYSKLYGTLYIRKSLSRKK